MLLYDSGSKLKFPPESGIIEMFEKILSSTFRNLLVSAEEYQPLFTLYIAASVAGPI